MTRFKIKVIYKPVLLATDKVLLLGVQNKLEEEVYDFAEELKVESNGRLRLEKLDFLKDGVRLAVYHKVIFILTDSFFIKSPSAHSRRRALSG